METWDWYYSSLSRLECEKILKDQKNGAFLIRQSESTSDHVLSICWDGHAHHYKIIRSPNGIHLNTAVGVEHVYFDTFDKLVAYYTVPDRGLMYTLTEPVRNEIMCMENSEDDDTDDSDYDEDDPVTPFFLQRLDILTGIRRDTSFKKYLLDYLSKGVKKDYQRVKNGSNNPSMFKEMLVHSADDLIESFQKFYARLKIIHELFDVGSNTEDDMNEIFKDTSSPHKDFDYLIKLLSECPGNISKLQKKMCKVLQEYSGQNSSDMVQRKKDPSKSTKETEYSVLTYDGKAGPTVENSECNTSTQKVFEVTSGPLKTKSYISLDVKCGHMIFLKNQNDKPENGTSYTSDQVIQLVKSKSSKVKLGIFLENTNVKNYHFENYRSRELFCSSVQQIKIAHMNDRQSSKQLSVFIGTWNMGDATADDIDEWFLCSGFGKTKLGDFSHIPEDIFAIGTQESAYHEKDWTNRLKSTLSKIFKEKFRLVTCYSMWDIRIVIFVKAELYNLVNCLKQSSVKTGIANTLGNKGAVGVSFNIASTSFCFINCHLTSGNEKILRRNQNFHSILKGLNVGQGDTFDLTLSFHHLFWFGDLNYRINLEVTDIIKKIMEKDWHKLMASDQLCAERINGNAFIDFIEVDLQFPPTYRYTRGTRSTYTWTKAKLTGADSSRLNVDPSVLMTRTNVPSWCDRVLWRSYPHLTSCNTTYGCTEKVCSSDHSPVFATFDVGVVSQTLAVDNQEHKTSCKVTGSCVKITMSSAEAKILTSSTTKFILEFHSTCFEQSVTSKKNSMDNIGQKQDSLFRGSIPGDRSYSYPWWTKNDLCVLQPVLSDPYYLENQHLLIAVKAEEGQESYGECIISLKPLLVGQPITLQQKLTHFGVSTGTLKLQCQMNVPEDYNYTPSMPTSKVYDLIKIEEENTNENRVLPDPVNKKEQKRIPIPKDNSRMIDRSSIQQVDPVNKVVESCHLVLDDRRKSLGLGFDNPMVKLRKSKENPDSLVKSFNGINHRASAPDFLDHSDTFGAPPTLPPKKKNTPKCPSTGDETLNSPINPRLEESDSEKALLETRFTQSLPRHLPSMKDIFYVPPASDALPLALPPALPPHEPHISKRLSNAPRYMPPEPPDLHTEELSPPVAQQRTKKKKRQISKFYDWLLEHGFETYYDILLKNGFDDLEYFCCVTEQDLLKIGVECDDDRKNIVAAAQALEKDRKNNFC